MIGRSAAGYGRAVDLRAFTEPQMGASYDQQLALARTAEEAGYDAFFRSDHYLSFRGDGLPGPTDAWVTLAGLARDTTRIRLGTLVTPATFRLPGPLAITVAQVDAMSGGRVELGLGAGWFGREHEAYGIPFPETVERFDRLEEQLAIVTGLWHTPVGETFSHPGPHYVVDGSPGLPKPVQVPGPPVIIGGSGLRRTPRLAATYASEFNANFSDAATAAAQYARVRAACEAIDRDPATMTWSAVQVLCLGENEADLARRAAFIGRSVDDLRAHALAGTPSECLDRLGAYAEAGASRIYLQFLDIDDLDHVRLAASTFLGQL
jgi:F420-dependent oxidoreductase-like protein